MKSKQQNTKPQSVRPSDKKLLEEQASGSGKHSGRQHPPVQNVVDAKQDKSALPSAHAGRAEKTGDSKYGKK